MLKAPYPPSEGPDRPQAVAARGRTEVVIGLWLTAAVVIFFPVAMYAVVGSSVYMVMRTGYYLSQELMNLRQISLGFCLRLGWLLAQGGFCLLLIRHLLGPAKRDYAWVPVMPLDQPRFHEMMRWLAASLRMPQPEEVAVDVTGNLRVNSGGLWYHFFGRGLRVSVGLSLAVALSSKQLVGLLAHEMTFHQRGRGALPGHIIRRVGTWLADRQYRDEWKDGLWREVRWGGPMGRLCMWVLWAAAKVAEVPMRVLYKAFLLVSTPALRDQIRMADENGARVAGSEAYAEALAIRGKMVRAWTELEAEVGGQLASQELPDNLPLLLVRKMLTTIPVAMPDGTRSHWLLQAPSDAARVRAVSEWSYRAAWNEGDVGTEATTIFQSFHELARRVTHFYYQNDKGQLLAQVRFLPVEESIFEVRRRAGGMEEPKKYFRGLAHPERACCGIVEEQPMSLEPEVIMMELIDAREYINHHTHQANATLTEWTKIWRMVRDLEAALAQKKAGLHIHKHQYAAFTVEDFQHEIEYLRAMMDSMENQLRFYEGKMETRMTCCLELLAREPMDRLPTNLRKVKQTLPHWVLVYEALGINLPVLRESLTTFGAFQALGATVAGRIDSAGYVATVQHLLPKVVQQMRIIATSLSQWPYPFSNGEGGQRLSIDRWLSPRLEELFVLLPDNRSYISLHDRREVMHLVAREVVCIVAPFLDRYLALYHQAFCKVTRAMQMAEWHFADPAQGVVPVLGVGEDLVVDDTPYDPVWLTRVERMADPEVEGSSSGSLLSS